MLVAYKNTIIDVQLLGFVPRLFLWLANKGIPNFKICFVSMRLHLAVGIV